MSKYLFLTIILFFNLFFNVVQAEYRVFILEIANSKTNQRRQIQSTLDPVQYSSLYPINPDESIMYQDTWLCRGNTSGFKQHCSRPPASGK